MYHLADHMIEALIEELRKCYRRTYGSLRTDYEEIIAWAADMALENIAGSDALYHNVEHTIQVTLVGQQILRGKHIRDGGVSPEDWLHLIISYLCHDIGYVKGVCRQDGGGRFTTGVGDKCITLPPGATDAALTPYHVDRGKAFIRERFAGHAILDVDVILRNMEHTRFPVPMADDYQGTADYPALLRAGDLIGQLADPRYLYKLPALFYEFEETGTNKALGYKNPGDLRGGYASFYWEQVYPYVQDALRYLSVTQDGRQAVSNLYSNIFIVEHEIPALY
jgi:hypothetical protein